MPIYNDADAVTLFIPRLDNALAENGYSAKLLLVDDFSRPSVDPSALARGLRAIRLIEVVRLRRNVGHQRAIAVGLLHALETDKFEWAVVMDADGEDRAEDVPRLLEALRNDAEDVAVFAERTRRSEGPLYSILYFLYRWTHYLLTGIPVRVGNFSAVGRATVSTLAVVSELWNHYAAAVHAASIPYKQIPTQRGTRLAGRSRMNFVSLALHGLSAISVFSPLVGVRLLVAIATGGGILLALTLVSVGLHLLTDFSVPVWALTTLAALLVLVVQLSLFVGVFLFLALNGRNSTDSVPIKDYQVLIDKVIRVET